MDCRKFHKDLEDYLEDGLDFSGRFGVERHAQQCIGCGQDLSTALRLRRMVQQLERTKAPANFELSVLDGIGKCREQGMFSRFRRFWIYGLDLPSARRLVLVSSCLAVLVIGIFCLHPFLSNWTAPESVSAPPPVVQEPAKVGKGENPRPAATTAVAKASRPLSAEIHKPKVKPGPAEEQMVDQEVSDYVEFQVLGPDNRPVSFRWPNKTHVRYGQTPEEYFIRNVSH